MVVPVLGHNFESRSTFDAAGRDNGTAAAGGSTTVAKVVAMAMRLGLLGLGATVALNGRRTTAEVVGGGESVVKVSCTVAM